MSTIQPKIPHDDIQVVAGDDWVILIPAIDESNQPVNLSASGVGLAWTVISPDGTTSPIAASAIVTPTSTPTAYQSVSVKVPRSETYGLVAGLYRDALQVSVGGVSTTIWEGNLVVWANPFEPENS